MSKYVSPLSGYRVVTVSPHLDDAAFSVGGIIYRLSQAGADVDAVTVYAGDPGSTTDSSHWDAKSGFTSAGQASGMRRWEDARACARIGARPVWGRFPDKAHCGPRGTVEEIAEFIRPRVAAADLVLVPGWPLRHPDHRELHAALTRCGPHPAVLAYREIPYGVVFESPRCPVGFGRLARSSSARPRRIAIRLLSDELRAKRAARRDYASQELAMGVQMHLIRAQFYLSGTEHLQGDFAALDQPLRDLLFLHGTPQERR